MGLDWANGAAWTIAESVFEALGAKTMVINKEPDGLNINTDCGSTHIEHLQQLVLENKLDVGFAYDGDADRCLCVDEKGNVITGDHILYIYGLYMKERGKLLNNTVVTTVMSNFGLYKALDRVGIEYEKTKVGDKYVYENMVQNGHRIGGEQSGHIIFTKYATTGDGILTSLKMMEVMLAKKKPLSELAAPVKFYPQVLKNVRVKSKPEAQNDPDVQAAVEAVAKALGQRPHSGPGIRHGAGDPRHGGSRHGRDLRKYVDQVIEVIRNKGHLASPKNKNISHKWDVGLGGGDTKTVSTYQHSILKKMIIASRNRWTICVCSWKKESASDDFIKFKSKLFSISV